MKSDRPMKLMVNQSGAWRNVVTFDAAQRNEVIGALVPLARVLGEGTSWCLLDDAGKREWLGTLSDAKRDCAPAPATEAKEGC